LAVTGKVGAAAILIHKGERKQTLHYHLGPQMEHTVHEAELVGILLAMHMLMSPKYRRKSAMIGVDNQAAIKAFDSDLRSPGHHLAREVERMAAKIEKERKKNKAHTRSLTTIRWTAGHEGLLGNELADREAKEAAKGQTSETKYLPRYLRKPLLTNPAAIRMAHAEALKEKWKTEWRNASRGKDMSKIDDSTPSSKFLNAISNPKLTRAAASKIAQLRLRHAPLNGYLKRIRKVDNARCPACGDEEESIEHFLLKCPNYAHERWPLAQLSRKKGLRLTLKTLLGDQWFVLPLAAFIHATGRFTELGEQTATQIGDAMQRHSV